MTHLAHLELDRIVQRYGTHTGVAGVGFQIVGGRKEKIRAGDVLGALAGDMGYTREQVGKINVNDFSTYVAVDRAIAAQAAGRLNSGRDKGKSVKARLIEDERG